MTGHGNLLLAAALGLAVLLAWTLWRPAGRRLGAVELLGAVLVAYPAARSLVGAAWVSPRLTTYTVLLPAPLAAFELAIVRDLTLSLLLPLGGALLLWHRRAGGGELATWRDLRPALGRVLAPAGLRLTPRQGGLRAWTDAFALLGVTLLLLVAAWLIQAGPGAFLVTGDESRYWRNLTLPVAVGLSLAAGLSEEFVWRGLLLRAMLGRMGYVPAMLLQGALFGFIHAGYGNWAHVLGPALFGLIMGVVALRVGLLAAVVVHAGLDVFYLGVLVPELHPIGLVVAGALLVIGLAAAAWTRMGAVRALLEPRPWKPGPDALAGEAPLASPAAAGTGRSP